MFHSGAAHVGDWVEVRPLGEILATLDARGCLDGMPFMPEMAALCGTRFAIFKSAHKTCDPTGATDLRRIKDAVHGGARCNGAAHGGCEARCLFFWKTAWLKPVDGPGPLKAPAAPDADLSLLYDHVAAPAQDGEIRHRCQATEIGRASTPLSAASLDHYVEDVSSGNESAVRVAAHVIAAAAAGVATKALRPILARRAEALAKRPRPAPPAPLGLKPGEIVEVRGAEDILATLTNGKNRGLALEKEMLKFSGKRFRVLARVSRIIDEKSGRMLHLKNDCVILEGLVCNGLNMRKRLFCPRAPYYYWREAWLRRVGDVPQERAQEQAA
jgi:hypothetical protein